MFEPAQAAALRGCGLAMSAITTGVQSAQQEVSPPPLKMKVGERYVALDALRGFVMFVLASEGFGFRALKHDPTYARIASWFDHGLLLPFPFLAGDLARFAVLGVTFP